MTTRPLTKFTLADLRACWGVMSRPTNKAKPARGPRKFPLDVGPFNCKLLDVREFRQARNYRQHASRDVAWLHAMFKARGQKVRICKRRHRDEQGRPYFQIVVVTS